MRHEERRVSWCQWSTRLLKASNRVHVKRKTDKCDFFFFYRQGSNAKHERKFNRPPINELGKLNCASSNKRPRQEVPHVWMTILLSIDRTPFKDDIRHTPANRVLCGLQSNPGFLILK